MSLRKFHSSLPVLVEGFYNPILYKRRNAMHGN